MRQQSKRRIWLAALGAAAVLLAAVASMLPAENAPKEMENARVSADRATVEEGCELLQTIRYTRCEHTVNRRMAAPVELYGKTLEEVSALYEEWQMTAFSPKEISMEQVLPLFCPEHTVLMPDGAGYVCVFENRYGDAMALVKQLSIEVKNLPAAAREEVEMGKGFSSPEELDAWLESVES